MNAQTLQRKRIGGHFARCRLLHRRRSARPPVLSAQAGFQPSVVDVFHLLALHAMSPGCFSLKSIYGMAGMSASLRWLSGRWGVRAKLSAGLSFFFSFIP